MNLSKFGFKRSKIVKKWTFCQNKVKKKNCPSYHVDIINMNPSLIFIVSCRDQRGTEEVEFTLT